MLFFTNHAPLTQVVLFNNYRRRLQGALDSSSIKPSKDGSFHERIDILKPIVELHHPDIDMLP